MSFIDFKAVKAAVSLEDAANLLKLSLKKTGNQLRGSCPACGNEDERIGGATLLREGGRHIRTELR
jgi:hypothetical protein